MANNKKLKENPDELGAGLSESFDETIKDDSEGKEEAQEQEAGNKEFKVIGVDSGGGKVHFEGTEGEQKSVTVNGKTGEVVIEGGLGIFAFGSSFLTYPVISIND